jgi:hypothetical protein
LEAFVSDARAVIAAIRERSVNMNYKGCLNHPAADADEEVTSRYEV